MAIEEILDSVVHDGFEQSGVMADICPAREQAEIEFRQAQARFFDAQTKGQEIDNDTARALADSAAISLKRERFKDDWDTASNGRNRVYHFTDSVTTESVENAVDVLNRWDRLDEEDPQRVYKFVICSGGGNVVAGMKLYSTLKAIAAKRHLITVASGICASMATVLHQTGTERVIEPGCSYMIHDVSGEAFGSITNMQDTMKWLSALNHQLHIFLAERATISVEKIQELGNRQDSWFMPDEVVEMGLADRIDYAS